MAETYVDSIEWYNAVYGIKALTVRESMALDEILEGRGLQQTKSGMNFLKKIKKDISIIYVLPEAGKIFWAREKDRAEEEANIFEDAWHNYFEFPHILNRIKEAIAVIEAHKFYFMSAPSRGKFCYDFLLEYVRRLVNLEGEDPIQKRHRLAESLRKSEEEKRKGREMVWNREREKMKTHSGN